MTISRARLADGAAALGLALDAAQLALFDRYAARLIEGAASFNLTTVRDPDGIVDRHFLDSLSALAALPPESHTVIDVGSGAGFPGVPLKIARTELDVVLLEATGKKARWLNETVSALDLMEIRAVAERAETLAHDAAHRERYDVAVARAVAPLVVLCELCLPFVRVGGVFVAQKSAAGAGAEAPAAERALEALGGRLTCVREVRHDALPNRVLVEVAKVGRTPGEYPRRPGLPAKKPL
ncbi:MAG TPA: 16S rRNA (guanine(527)-N(7))-methyltransferase RsmG [Chloroflexota bacterium]|nr:16S rRNA (guanine(527)-N(7))-methyltransferase RsmG [Chloroflexota bacterium]